MNIFGKPLTKISSNIAKVFLASVICVMTTAVLTGLTTVSNNVTIHEDGTVYSRYTIYTELEDILENENISIGENDKCEFTGFTDHEADIYITRAFEVSVTADGETQSVVVADGTVQDVLDKVQVSLSEEDLINVPLTESVVKGMEVVIQRVTYQETQETSEIPYEVIQPEVQPTSRGRIVTAVPGENGEKVTTTRTKYVDGEAVESVVVAEEITKQPVNEQLATLETIYVGGYKKEVSPDQVPVELDANGNPVNYAYKVTGKATAYSALGRPTKLKPGDVAMNLSQFPKGTKLYIKTPNGGYVYGYSTVRDTGVAVNDGRVLVDCYFVTYDESCQFGAKTVDVYVLN